MASGPFKIRLKLSKPGEARSERPPPDASAHSKKRQRLDDSAASASSPGGGRLVVRASADAVTGPQSSKQPSAAFGQATRPVGQGRAGEGAGEPAAARPRLVIKGSFGGGQARSAQPDGGLAVPSNEKRHKEKKHHKEKKRKKHKDRPPGELVPVTVAQLPQDLSRRADLAAERPLPPAEAGAARAAVANGLPVGPVAARGEAVRPPPGLRPPAKPAPLLAAKTASQAPSGATGASIDGLTQASRDPGEAGAAGQEVASRPSQQPSAGDVERVIQRLQKKDPHHFFRDPVTDAVAPGYTQVIKRPMSFSQMRARLAAGDYVSWKPVQEDLETIFNNAMVFNGPLTPYHQKAREMMAVARKLLHTVRTTGQLELPRGRKPAAAGGKPPVAAAAAGAGASAAAAPLPEKRMERRAAATAAAAAVTNATLKPERTAKAKGDKKRVAARKAAQRAAASGILAKPGADDWRGGDGGAGPGELGARALFPQLRGQPVETQWGGLAGGASAEGVEYGRGRPALRANFTGALTLECYSKSLKAFGRKLPSFARQLLDRRLAAAAVKPEVKPAPVVQQRIGNPAQQPWGAAGHVRLTSTPHAGMSAPLQTPWNTLMQRPLVPGASVVQSLGNAGQFAGSGVGLGQMTHMMRPEHRPHQLQPQSSQGLGASSHGSMPRPPPNAVSSQGPAFSANSLAQSSVRPSSAVSLPPGLQQLRAPAAGHQMWPSQPASGHGAVVQRQAVATTPATSSAAAHPPVGSGRPYAGMSQSRPVPAHQRLMSAPGQQAPPHRPNVAVQHPGSGVQPRPGPASSPPGTGPAHTGRQPPHAWTPAAGL